MCNEKRLGGVTDLLCISLDSLVEISLEMYVIMAMLCFASVCGCVCFSVVGSLSRDFAVFQTATQ